MDSIIWAEKSTGETHEKSFERDGSFFAMQSQVPDFDSRDPVQGSNLPRGRDF